MKNLLKYLLIVAVIVGMSACQEEFEPGETATKDVAGVWQAEHFYDGDSYGYCQIETYNTAANIPTEFWITDYGNFWDYKVKCPVDIQTLTFSGTDLTNAVEDYDILISIQNGKILPGAAVSASGQPVDSIYFEIKYGDGGDDFHVVAGERYTGFPADDL